MPPPPSCYLCSLTYVKNVHTYFKPALIWSRDPEALAPLFQSAAGAGERREHQQQLRA